MSEATSAEAIPSYDVNIWGTRVFDFTTIEAFITAPLPAEGIVRIGQGFGKVEFKLENSGPNTLSQASCFLVCFCGAASNRTAVTAPLFSGIGLSRALEIPLLAFADPVVSASPAVNLGWYAGGSGGVGHPRDVAWVIDHVARITGRTPLLVGGSGGGFAAMSIMRYLAVPVRCFVWNPQTSIAEYHAKFVRNYINVAFPGSRDADALNDILNEARVDQDVRSATYAAPSCLVYLQNESDHHHVQNHMKPFMERLGQWYEHDSATRVSADRRIIVRTGNWGKGHAVPPTALIQAMIALLGRCHGQADPWEMILGELPSVLNSPTQAGSGYDLDARATLSEGEVSVTVDVSRLPAGLSYAYYLMEDGVRAATQWYSSNSAAKFQTAIENASRLSAVVFARSGRGTPTRRRINVEPTWRV